MKAIEVHRTNKDLLVRPLGPSQLFLTVFEQKFRVVRGINLTLWGLDGWTLNHQVLSAHFLKASLDVAV